VFARNYWFRLLGKVNLQNSLLKFMKRIPCSGGKDAVISCMELPKKG
jgi:hypothetical protein